jgi:PAS domain S-box-containing protein
VLTLTSQGKSIGNTIGERSHLKQSNTGKRSTFDPALQLEAIFQAYPDLLFCIDNDGLILSYQAGKGSYLDLPSDQIIGHSLQEIFPEDVGMRFAQAFRDAAQRNQKVSIEYQISTPAGERWFEGHLIPTKNNSGIIAVIRDITERAKHVEQIQTQVRKLFVHHTVDAAITASFDLKVTLSVILRQMMNQLNADAADILVLNPSNHMLEFASGLGFQKRNQPSPVMIGQGIAGRAALERRTISISELENQSLESLFPPTLVQENFANYYAVPLIAKGQVKGVMEIYHRTFLQPKDEWLDFLSAIAGQAAVAIDSAFLYHELQQANTELSLAYDSAIESWAQVLELSNRESGAHAYRVVELTIKLARYMGIAESELIHFRRGALLHDVGKLGISENILNKAGPLDENEKKTMQNHPVLAYQLLSSVNFLAPALDIPHYHHERWDGSGYPDGLHGEQIPFPARLFAVVDVYDALTSTRTYRPASTRQVALNYIKENSGTHFDPDVVKAFLKVMEDIP